MHMVAVCRALRIALITFVHPARRLEAIRSAYSMPYAHVDSTDLESSEHLDPPAAKTQRGRKQKSAWSAVCARAAGLCAGTAGTRATTSASAPCRSTM